MADNLVEMIAMAFSSSMMLEQVGTQSVVRKSLRTRILHYIDTNLCDPLLSNAQIAQAAGISIRYLHKLFQQETESIHALILRKRLERSRDLINDSAYAGHSIEQIAYSTGFSSAAHFSRSFKKHFGLSPSDLR